MRRYVDKEYIQGERARLLSESLRGAYRFVNMSLGAKMINPLTSAVEKVVPKGKNLFSGLAKSGETRVSSGFASSTAGGSSLFKPKTPGAASASTPVSAPSGGIGNAALGNIPAKSSGSVYRGFGGTKGGEGVAAGLPSGEKAAGAPIYDATGAVIRHRKGALKRKVSELVGNAKQGFTNIMDKIIESPKTIKNAFLKGKNKATQEGAQEASSGKMADEVEGMAEQSNLSRLAWGAGAVGAGALGAHALYKSGLGREGGAPAAESSGGSYDTGGGYYDGSAGGYGGYAPAYSSPSTVNVIYPPGYGPQAGGIAQQSLAATSGKPRSRKKQTV